jgi:hypothetical protein
MSFQNNNIKTNSKTSLKQSSPLLDTVLKDSSNKKRRIPISNTKQKFQEPQKQSFIITKGKNKTLAVKNNLIKLGR